jgi:thiamine kinase-like enzyme
MVGIPPIRSPERLAKKSRKPYADSRPLPQPTGIHLCEDAWTGWGTFALAHWDYRVENLFFKEDDPDVAVIDWQLMMWMKPAWDFAYLCFTNLNLEDRRAWLDDLATLYLEELAGLGVRDYTKDDLMADICLCLVGISAVPVIGGSSVDSTNLRSMELLATVSERVFAGIEDMKRLERVSCLR